MNCDPISRGEKGGVKVKRGVASRAGLHLDGCVCLSTGCGRW